MSGKKPILQHLAIIPDGNRRWAKKQGILDKSKIYTEGGKRISEVIESTFQQEIPYLTLWLSSYSNLLNRSQQFKSLTEKIYRAKFSELASHPMIIRGDVKICVYGEWRELFAQNTVKVIESAIIATASHSSKTLTFLVGYDGKREIGSALINLIHTDPNILLYTASDIAVAEQQLRKHAWTGNLPDVDLIIRTGSSEDPHNSASFLNFSAGDSQLAFPDILWPDFSHEILLALLSDYSERERRLGR